MNKTDKWDIGFVLLGWVVGVIIIVGVFGAQSILGPVLALTIGLWLIYVLDRRGRRRQ